MEKSIIIVGAGMGGLAALTSDTASWAWRGGKPAPALRDSHPPPSVPMRERAE